MSSCRGGRTQPSIDCARVPRGQRKRTGCQNRKDPQAYFKDQIWVDSLVFSPEAVRHLVAEIGPSQIVYGSDMPFSWPDTSEDVLNAPTLTQSDRTAILRGTAARLLKL